MIFFVIRKFFNMPRNFKMSEVHICPSHDLLRCFILQATTMIGAHRNIVVLLKISVFVYIFFVPAVHLSGTISCAAPSPKSWVDPSWDRPSQNRAWAPPNFGTFSCARPQDSPPPQKKKILSIHRKADINRTYGFRQNTTSTSPLVHTLVQNHLLIHVGGTLHRFARQTRIYRDSYD